MPIKIFQVDAFSDQAFGGNPACVCLMKDEASDEWMQSVAAEMNLSETAFVWQRDDEYQIRWFTPESEVDLCGHATLATSHVLWREGWLAAAAEAVFDSRSGRLTASQVEGQIVLNFPAKPPTAVDAPEGLLKSLGIEGADKYVGTDQTDYMVEVELEDTVRGLTPDFASLKKTTARGIIVTSRSDCEQYDFVSRFFGPAVGIDEDPVTGSAHTMLAPYWSTKLGKSKMNAFQASRRGGSISVELVADRVHLGGHAKTVFCGELLI